MNPITYHNPELFSRATALLKQLYGENASFRDGQYEAIEATITRRRTLVVQRTGWGKSLVYFICAKLMRSEKHGVTLVVSPLLVLMENQMEAARKMGLRCDVLNSTSHDRQADILTSMEKDELDLVLVTPETLFGEEVQDHIRNIKIGLFVIDEAHCISDWGHDFRLDYGNLKKIVSRLPDTVPILATTATANDRVVTDLCAQLGNDVFISRGPLTRESLYIQVVNKPSKIKRYAWMLENIPKLPGCGIVYCLTHRDCDYLADFLNQNDIPASAYYSRDGEDGAKLNRTIEENFKNNKLKVIVATIKLGMGYDKGDIAFVIHYQMPANIVSYYQQIGRAGRNIDKAYIFLMCGQEDEDILDYFIRTAFPDEKETDMIMAYIGNRDGVSEHQIAASVNIRRSRIRKALAFLENDGFIRTDAGLYYITPNQYYYDKERYDAITASRIEEAEQVKKLTRTDQCYSKFIVSCLDDADAHDCGHCANCLKKDFFPSAVSPDFVHIAEEYVNGMVLSIEPRKMWETSSVTKRSLIEFQNQPGLCLSKYGDAGYGDLVRQGKYSAEKRFCDELVGKSAELLKPFIAEHQIQHISCVPSLRSDLVKEFAVRLAASLGISFVDLLDKADAVQQKKMENSSFQCANAYRAFSVKENAVIPKNLLLVDDMVDSRWTLTVCGYRLMEAGAEKVYPYALADSSNREA